MKDLIIAFSSGYKFDHIKYWVNSIRKTDFKGDVVVVTDHMSNGTKETLTEIGVIVASYGVEDEFGDIQKPETNSPPHVIRFFYLWDYLTKNIDKEYRYVIATDIRDVFFQKSPSEYLENALVFHSFVASSEGMRYKNEPWGRNNLIQSYGMYFYESLKENYIYNVGVLAGETHLVTGMLLLILQMSTNRAIKIVDQASYNVLINNPILELDVFKTTNADGWAINLGTTIEAVKAGSGDLGQNFVSDINGYKVLYEDYQPSVKDDSIVNGHGDDFVIVHQWDRIPSIKTLVEKKYG